MPNVSIKSAFFCYRPFVADDVLAVSQAIERLQHIDRSNLLTKLAELNQAAQVGLIGWRGVADDRGEPLPFVPTMLGAVLTPAELGEMFVLSVRARMAEAGRSTSIPLFDAAAIAKPTTN